MEWAIQIRLANQVVLKKIKTTIQPGAAFDLPDNSKLSGSSMNDLDDEEDFPF